MGRDCRNQSTISGLGSHKKYRRPGIPKLKATQDGIKGIDFKLCSPISEGGNLEINREQEGTLHTGRSSWLRAEDRVFVPHEFIRKGKVKIPKPINDIPGRMGKKVRNRIIFTKLSKKKVLIGGMAARVNR